jgi:hypothetical protein
VDRRRAAAPRTPATATTAETPAVAEDMGDELPPPVPDAVEYSGTGDAGPGVAGEDAATPVSAPSVRQLHYLKMGLDEEINRLEAQLDQARARGQKPGATLTRLTKARATREELLGVLEHYAPTYGEVAREYARDGAPDRRVREGHAHREHDAGRRGGDEGAGARRRC